MENEIPLYGSIGTYSSEYLIERMNKIKGNDISLRINTPGGDVVSCYGVIAKFKEFTGTKKIKVDGMAMSMGAMFCAYADDVQALDVSEFMIHRAAYYPTLERNPDFFTEERKSRLQKMNDDLRAALESKIDEDKLKEIKGVTLDEIFSLDDRIDVFLTAEQALEIGLIESINAITPETRNAILTNYSAAASYNSEEDLKSIYKPEKITGKINNSNNQKSKKMTLEELKKDHPGVYAEAVKDGDTSANAVKEEKERIQALLELREADPELIDAKIEDGSVLSQVEIVKLTKAMYAKGSAKGVEDDAHEDFNTDSPKGEEEKSDEEKEYAKYEADLDAKLSLSK